MKIEKLPSGSYRIRMQENGRKCTITLPYKPTEKQAYQLLRDKLDRPSSKYDRMTFCEALDALIDSKVNILSPATIRGYRVIQRALSDDFRNTELSKMDNQLIQAEMNQYALTHSAKSVRNAHGLVMSVLNTFLPSLEVRTTLPKKVPKKAYMPTKEEVAKLLEYAKNSEYYVALCLACSSCRRSEYAAATLDDIWYDKKGNAYLHICKALVPDENNKYVVKDMPKTQSSVRDIPLPPDLLKRILDQGYIYRYNINAVDKYLRTTLPKLGIPTFSIHQLRHFYASYMTHLGFDSASIKAGGGWEMNSNIMESVYLEEMESDKTRQEMSMALNSLF